MGFGIIDPVRSENFMKIDLHISFLHVKDAWKKVCKRQLIDDITNGNFIPAIITVERR
jgi:hypothetical protein